MKKCGIIFENLIDKIKFYIKLELMDEWWKIDGICIGLFPPVFNYTHTQKEMDQIAKEEISYVRTKIDEVSKMDSEIKV